MCFFVLSPVSNTHYLKGFNTRAEAWKSFTEFEMVFSHSGNENSVASKTPDVTHQSKGRHADTVKTQPTFPAGCFQLAVRSVASNCSVHTKTYD